MTETPITPQDPDVQRKIGDLVAYLETLQAK